MLEGVWVCFEIPRIYVRLRESGKSDLMALHEFAIKMGNRISTTSESKVSRKNVYIYTYIFPIHDIYVYYVLFPSSL